MKRAGAFLGVLGLVAAGAGLATPEASAQGSAASASASTTSSASASAASSIASAAPPGVSASAAPPVASARVGDGDLCVESVPEGARRPVLRERFPERGLAGHVALLEVVIEHGAGETPLPGGAGVDASGSAARSLARAGFALPHPDGGSGPTLISVSGGAGTESTLRLPLVALPERGGRSTLTLPPLPVSVSRANGSVVTVCTRAHSIVIDDPTASTPDAKVRDNPDPRRQLETWVAARRVAETLLVALIVAAIVAPLAWWWRRRPKAVPPAPPPRPPWETALEALYALRGVALSDDSARAEHYEQIANVVRRYLGERYGFDGLECTTREILGVLRRVVPPITVLTEVESFLREADLVKFARLTPSEDECQRALGQALLLVERTVPPQLRQNTPREAWA